MKPTGKYAKRWLLTLLAAGVCRLAFAGDGVEPRSEAEKVLANAVVNLGNPDFENGETGEVPPGWSFWKREPEAAGKAELTADAADGKMAVRIVAGGTRDWAFTNKAAIAVKEGDGFVVTLRAKNNAEAPPASVTLQASGYQGGKIVNYDTGFVLLRGLGKTWEPRKMLFRVPASIDTVKIRLIGDGPCDITVDSVAMAESDEARKLAAPPAPKTRQPHKPVAGFAPAPVREKLDRALVALPDGDGRVYLSWRLLADDPDDIAFDAFAVAGGKETRLNAAPITQTTDFVVEQPVAEASYLVRLSGVPGNATAAVRPEAQPAKIFKLSDESAIVHKVGIGDLDGDGRYDYVVRYGNANVDPWHLFWKPSAKPLVLEAVDADGKTLWVKNLTHNLESGIWYAPFVVYDVDGDGKAEVVLKAFDDHAGDLREPDGPDRGKVMKGEEFLMVLEGATGKEIARAPWPSRDAFAGLRWDYNYYSRNQLAVAYLDGKTPCILALRGTYGRMLADAWQLKDGKLERLWQYDNEGWGKPYWGQGAHTTRAIDLDGDGRDEVILGGAVLDDDGQPLWSTAHGHPDYVYAGQLLSGRPGAQVATIYEYATRTGGFTVADGKTGAVIWESDVPAKHIHYGYAGDIDPTLRGWEIGGTDTGGGHEKRPDLTRHHSAEGKLLAAGEAAPYHESPRFLFWDADLQRELATNVVRDHGGGPSGGGFVGKFIMQADVLGDWREEAVTAVRGELRIYPTTIPAMDRRVCLMQDHGYRLTVCANAMGYTYDPVPANLFTDSAPNLNLTYHDRPRTPSVRVVVSAPLDKGLKGNLKLFPPGGVEADRTEWPVDLAPGGLQTFTVELEKPFGESRPLRAELTLDNGTVLRGRVPLGEKPAPKIAVSGRVIEAEDFVGQTGGNVQIRTDKVGVHGKSFSHWDKEGHELVWKPEVPEAGRYVLSLRYCCEHDACRRVTLNGKDLGEFPFPATGGFGSTPEDWQSITLRQGGGDRVLALPAGVVEVRIANVGDTAMNLDYLQLLPLP